MWKTHVVQRSLRRIALFSVRSLLPRPKTKQKTNRRLTSATKTQGAYKMVRFIFFVAALVTLGATANAAQVSPTGAWTFLDVVLLGGGPGYSSCSHGISLACRL